LLKVKQMDGQTLEIQVPKNVSDKHFAGSVSSDEHSRFLWQT